VLDTARQAYTSYHIAISRSNLKSTLRVALGVGKRRPEGHFDLLAVYLRMP